VKATARVALALALVVCSGSHAQESAPAEVPPIPPDRNRTTLPSGLEISFLAPGGSQAPPKLGDKVTVHYTGWFPDGKVFDSTRKTGKPAEFRLGRVIEGWSEALQMMSPGAQVKITVPPDLGYGSRGSPPSIPKDATLIFEIELVSVTLMPALPAYRDARLDGQKSTPSGLVYEILEPGSGDAPRQHDIVEIRYAIWNKNRKLVDCTDLAGRPLSGPTGNLPVRFLDEAVLLLKKGGRMRVEVPPEQCFGSMDRGALLPPDSPTVWEIELANVKRVPMPRFQRPDPAKGKITATGVLYESLKEGFGRTPKKGSVVAVHYAGWVDDGTLFDASFLRGRPEMLEIDRLIPGWQEALLLMKEGGALRAEIPPALGYGTDGLPPRIPGNATLLFYIELINVQG
jgi:FKBP-type peptidyl-prolyl cis-trans isomerase